MTKEKTKELQNSAWSDEKSEREQFVHMCTIIFGVLRMMCALVATRRAANAVA